MKINVSFKQLIIGIIITLLTALCCFSIKSCRDYKNQGKQNVLALTDSIHYYKTKNGELVATKELLNGDLSVLKLANDSLYSVIKDMKLKNPTSVVYINSEIDNGIKDTIWHYAVDSITKTINVQKQFAFDNEFRTLEGIVSVNDTTIGLNIEKDKVYFDYTVAIEDSKVYLKSNNPYIKFNEITGITIPSPKKKHFGLTIGPSVWYGYDFVAKKSGYGIGVSATIGWTPIKF